MIAALFSDQAAGAWFASHINDALGVVDRHAWVYRGPCLLAPLLFCGYALWKVFHETEMSAELDKKSPWFWPFGFFILLIGRWPYLIMNTFFNPDESQQLAGGLTLLRHPIFWRDLDGHTAGPLDFYFLSAIGLFGLPLNYLVGRLATIVLNATSLWPVYKIFRLFTTSARARLLVAPLLCFYTWMNDIDTIMLSTEQVPTCLLIASLYCFLDWIKGERAVPKLLFFSGLLAGLTPWAKLQTAPSALALVVGAAAFVLFQKTPTPQKQRSLFWLSAGFAVPSLFFFGALLVWGLLPTFYESYIAANFLYTTTGQPWGTVIQSLWEKTDVLHPLIIATIFWAAISGGALVFRRERPSSLYVVALLTGAVSLFTCLAPGRAFPHYTLFLVAPCGLILGASCWEFFRNKLARPSFWRLGVGLFALSVVCPLLVFRLGWKNLPERRMQAYWGLGDSAPAKILKPLLKTGDTLAVWGWYPHIYVELQISQGVRDAHSERAIVPSAIEAYYKNRYLSDLQTNRPTAFVDATGPLSIFFNDPASSGLPAFPEIREYIESQYNLIYDQPDARVYLRKDRI